ncbi:MAG TPA: class II aldolase/adducin family protein [Dongiaceae bacterium]|jgi:L-fuculose-phosphate aldolase|nr:class II aldolase/adducin family protein [Dongiaceae bacterium]
MSLDQARTELLTALRILEANGIIDFNGHASVRLESGAIINSGRSVRSRLAQSDLVAVDPEGKARPGDDAPPMEVHLHAEIYRRRPDVGAIVHGHPTWSTLLSSAGTPYAPVYPQGALLGTLPVFASPRSINTPELGRQVAELLGSGNAVLMRAHGMVVVGPDVRTATILALYLEENARRQCLAAPLGEPYRLSQAEIEGARAGLSKPNLIAKAWDYYAAKLQSGD